MKTEESSIEHYLKNLTKKMSKNEFIEYIKECRLNRNRLDVCFTFSMRIVQLFHESYLGKEYIKTPKDMKGHFDWCFKACCDEFAVLNLNFHKNKELKDYFREHFNFYIYSQEEKDKTTLEEDKAFMYNILNLNEPKTNLHVSGIAELYSIFNNSFKSKVETKQLN